MLLQHGDRHHAIVRVTQMLARFGRLHLARTLQQDAGDDLQAVGHAVLDFMQQQLLFAHKIVSDFISQSLLRYICYRENNANAFSFEIIERMRVNQQMPCWPVCTLQFHFIHIDRRLADIELYYTSHNRRLADEIESLR